MPMTLLRRAAVAAALLACCWPGGSLRAATFTDVAAAVGLDTGGSGAGLVWADFNADGYPDVLVNTADATLRTRLYFSDANPPDPTFSDVTATHAAGLLADTAQPALMGSCP